MEPVASVTTAELARLIDLHLGDLRPKNPCFKIDDSPISGRGLFAVRDIEAGEEIFREHTLLVGPTAHKKSKLNTCTICYTLINGTDDEVICPAGCTLPVCVECAKSERHATECKLFRKWIPKDKTRVDPRSLRVLSVVRCFFLNENQRNLLYALQANPDKYYKREIERAAECFEHFPKESDMVQYFYRTCCAYNTNAFEGRSRLNGNEVFVRALFPMSGLMNHQCTPNASHRFDNVETIVISATRSIKKGEEITTTYSKVLWSTLARKLFLGITKHFVCQCARCLDPTVSKIVKKNQCFFSTIIE